MEHSEDSRREGGSGKERERERERERCIERSLFLLIHFCRKLSFIEWFLRFQPGTRLHTAFKTEVGSKVKSLVPLLSENEQAQMGDVINRAETLARVAEENMVRLMIDAEQTYFQPAISHIAVNVLMPKYNLTTPIIYNTVQCYLKVRGPMLLSLAQDYHYCLLCHTLQMHETLKTNVGGKRLPIFFQRPILTD